MGNETGNDNRNFGTVPCGETLSPIPEIFFKNFPVPSPDSEKIPKFPPRLDRNQIT